MRPQKDEGTPELKQKRADGITRETADYLFEKGVLNEEQHHAARRLAWLFRLRHGKAWVSAINLGDEGGCAPPEQDSEWNARREQEYISAIASMKSAPARKAVFDSCIYDHRPSGLRERENLLSGLDELVKFWKRSTSNRPYISR